MTHEVKIHCDIVHPASGEVLAEAGETLIPGTPKTKHVLSVVFEYPEHYHSTLIVDSPPFDDYDELEGCPTDEELQLMQEAADQEQEERDAWFAGRGMGKDWEARHPLVEFVAGWSEGRGYD